MDDTLIVDYEKLESDTVAELKVCEAKVGDVYDDMKTIVNSLSQYMEAESAQAYIHEFEQLVGPSIQEMEKLISSYYRQLQDVAEYFANKDTAMSQRIGY